MLVAAAAGIATLACIVGLRIAGPHVESPHSYRTMVQLDSAKIVAASEVAQRDCGAANLATCSADTASVHDDVTGFQGDLDSHPAPACLKAADADLRVALAEYRQSTEALLYGLTHGEPTVAQRSVAQSASGRRHLAAASVDLQSASC